MKIYNEGQSNEKQKTVQREKDTRKWGAVKISIPGDKQIKGKHDIKWNKRNGDFKVRLHQANFHILKNKLKNNLDPAVVVNTFNPSTEEKALADI